MAKPPQKIFSIVRHSQVENFTDLASHLLPWPVHIRICLYAFYTVIPKHIQICTSQGNKTVLPFCYPGRASLYYLDKNLTFLSNKYYYLHYL